VNLRERFAHWAMVASLETIGRSAHNRLMRLAQSPEDAQRDALIKIVRLCQDTAQGRRFGLERVHTVDDFRHAVPIQSYEDMRPAIEREVATGTREIARALTNSDWDGISRLRLSDAQENQLRQFLHGFVIYHLGKLPRGRAAALTV